MRLRILGHNHVETIIARRNLALTLVVGGDEQSAKAVFGEANIMNWKEDLHHVLYLN
jgi:hypothetical protein